MATNNVRLHNANIAKLLKSEAFAQLVNDAAHRVAAAAGDDARVDEYTTDRNAAEVAVPAEQQAVDGTLTRAAAANGLEVRQKP